MPFLVGLARELSIIGSDMRADARRMLTPKPMMEMKDPGQGDEIVSEMNDLEDHVCTRMKGMEKRGDKEQNNQALPPIQSWTDVARVFVVADGDSIRVDNNGRGCND